MIKGLYRLIKKELLFFSRSASAWIILGIFMTLTAVFFNIHINEFSAICSRTGFNPAVRNSISVNSGVIRNLEYDIAILMLIIVPVMTMGSFAREAEQRTLGLLFSGIFNTWQIAISKFLAMAIVSSIFILVTLIFPLICFYISEPEILPVISGFTGLLLMVQALAAIGCMTSIICKKRVTACLMATGINIGLWVLGFSLGSGDMPLLKYASNLSLNRNFFWMSQGLIPLSNIFYYVMLSLICLLITKLFLSDFRKAGKL